MFVNESSDVLLHKAEFGRGEAESTKNGIEWVTMTQKARSMARYLNEMLERVHQLESQLRGVKKV